MVDWVYAKPCRSPKKIGVSTAPAMSSSFWHHVHSGVFTLVEGVPNPNPLSFLGMKESSIKVGGHR